MKTLFSIVLSVVLILVASVASASNCQLDQKGCYTLFAVRAAENPAVSSMLVAGDADHQLGMKLMRGYRAGQVSPAAPGNQLYLVWGTDEAPNAYAINSPKGKPVPVTFEDVTGKVSYPKTPLGAPTKVYRVKADGFGVGLQFSAIALQKAKILVCAEDSHTVYPENNGGEKKQGLVVTENQFAVLLQNGVPGGFAPFIFPAK